jgi:hypothetical protein
MYTNILRTYLKEHVKNIPLFKQVLISEVAKASTSKEKDNLTAKFDNFLSGETKNPRSDFIDQILLTIDRMRIKEGHGPNAIDVLNNRHWKEITTWKDLLIETVRMETEFLPKKVKENINDYDELRKQMVLLYKTVITYCSHESPEQFMVNMKILNWFLTDERSFKEIMLSYRVLFPRS